MRSRSNALPSNNVPKRSRRRRRSTPAGPRPSPVVRGSSKVASPRWHAEAMSCNASPRPWTTARPTYAAERSPRPSRGAYPRPHPPPYRPLRHPPRPTHPLRRTAVRPTPPPLPREFPLLRLPSTRSGRTLGPPSPSHRLPPPRHPHPHPLLHRPRPPPPPPSPHHRPSLRPRRRPLRSASSAGTLAVADRSSARDAGRGCQGSSPPSARVEPLFRLERGMQYGRNPRPVLEVIHLG